MKDHSHHCFFTYSVKRELSIIFYVGIKHTLVRWSHSVRLACRRPGRNCLARASGVRALPSALWVVAARLQPAGGRWVRVSGLGAIRQVWRRATRSEDSVRRGV